VFAAGAMGGSRRDLVAVVAARTSVVASVDRRLSLHGVVSMVGGLQPTMAVAQVAQLFFARFRTAE
jgi:hypothetical protein